MTRTIRNALVVGLALAVAACAHPPRPSLTLAARPAGVVRAAARYTAPLRLTSLAARVAAMFSASRNATVAPPGAHGPTWDIDVRSYQTNERVEYYVARFSGPDRERMAEQIERGTRYDAMIRGKLRQGGLPEDLSYVALIESGYSPHAYSRAAAVGMWQLMAGTARGLGLRVDGWVDERRDPVRSTDAAIRFLRWLHDEFGSLYLAAAAYNGGPGRISRGITRFAVEVDGPTDDGFFALAAERYLPNETKEYVPQLIAAALVAKEPTRYGIQLHPLPPFAYDSVRIPAMVPLAAVARASGTSIEQILDLNPHYLRGVTPPGGSSLVRVPVGRGDGFPAAFDSLPEVERSAVTRLTMERSRTLGEVARLTGRPARLIAAFNPRLGSSTRTRLAAGRTLLIPTAAVLAATRGAPGSELARSAWAGEASGQSLASSARQRRTTARPAKKKA